jgi:hypothetical protein
MEAQTGVWLMSRSVDDAGVLEFTCDSASLRCSSHVENLGLDERFELDVRVTLRPDATCLTADASVAVTVDLPMPFSLLPKPVLNQLSDGVMQTMSSLFLVRSHACPCPAFSLQGHHKLGRI